MSRKLKNIRVLDSYLSEIYNFVRRPAVFTGRITANDFKAYREAGCVVADRIPSREATQRYNAYCREVASLNFYRHAPASRRFADKAARMYV